MLKATSPKVLVEASMDKTWGTGIQLHDPSALDVEKVAQHWLDVINARNYQVDQTQLNGTL